MESDQKRAKKETTVSYLNLHLHGLYKDLRKLIYRKLNYIDRMIVKMVHNKQLAFGKLRYNDQSMQFLLRKKHYNILRIPSLIFTPTTSLFLFALNVKADFEVLTFLHNRLGEYGKLRFKELIRYITKLTYKEHAYLYYHSAGLIDCEKDELLFCIARARNWHVVNWLLQHGYSCKINKNKLLLKCLEYKFDTVWLDNIQA